MLKVLVRDPENLKSVLSEDREWFMKEYAVILMDSRKWVYWRQPEWW